MVQDFLHPQFLKHITLRCRAKILRVKDGESKAEFRVYPADVMSAGTTVQAKIKSGHVPKFREGPQAWALRFEALRAVKMRVSGGCGFRCLRFVSCGNSWSFEEPKVYALRPRCC